MSIEAAPDPHPGLRRATAAVAALGLCLATSPAQGGAEPQPAAPPPTEAPSGPWRLSTAVGLPDWLRIGGQIRLRYEAIEGQFRSPTRLLERDHYFTMRSNLLIEADLDPVGAAVEILDARQYDASEGSVLNTTIVDSFDFLQANLDLDLGALGDGRHGVRAGRRTMDLGSRRLVARNAFRNTINAFDGVSWEWAEQDGAEANVFWTLPVRGLPRDRGSLLDNEQEFDEHDLDEQFYGAFLSTPLAGRTTLEIYTYVLDEDSQTSLRRELYTPGFRLLRERTAGGLDYEVESALQFGDSTLLSDGTGLDHLAFFVHASVGYTFAAAWRPRLRVAYDYASGDRDPNDGNNERFDTLFGARRFEFGPTGIYGAIARSNLSSPELRLELRPGERTRVMTAVRGVWLAEASDAWVPAALQDPTGQSGRHVGDQIEASIRYDLLPKNVDLEVGGAYLFAGSFQERAPGGRGQDTAYAYVQMTLTF
jgi:hypothetical protein